MRKWLKDTAENCDASQAPTRHPRNDTHMTSKNRIVQE